MSVDIVGILELAPPYSVGTAPIILPPLYRPSREGVDVLGDTPFRVLGVDVFLGRVEGPEDVLAGRADGATVYAWRFDAGADWQPGVVEQPVVLALRAEAGLDSWPSRMENLDSLPLRAAATVDSQPGRVEGGDLLTAQTEADTTRPTRPDEQTE